MCILLLLTLNNIVNETQNTNEFTNNLPSFLEVLLRMLINVVELNILLLLIPCCESVTRTQTARSLIEWVGQREPCYTATSSSPQVSGFEVGVAYLLS